jgi:hypothetical protein
MQGQSGIREAGQTFNHFVVGVSNHPRISLTAPAGVKGSIRFAKRKQFEQHGKISTGIVQVIFTCE